MELPVDSDLPDLIVGMTADENQKMLKMGYECYKMVVMMEMNMRNDETYKRLKNESETEKNAIRQEMSGEIKKQEIINEVLKEIYENEKNKMSMQIKELERNMLEIRKNNEPEMDRLRDEIHDNIKREFEEKQKRQDNELMRMEFEVKSMKDNLLIKDEMIRKISEFHEYMRKQNETKTSHELGYEGEELFEKYANMAFRDYNLFRIENKARMARKGDYHLFFEKFNILVDVKNYDGNVKQRELEKIERDLISNKSMDFAWLVSLRSDVCEWNKSGIMFKWILTDEKPKCIFIVNNLCKHEEPVEMLRNVLTIMSEVNDLLNANEIESEAIKTQKKNNYLLSLKIKNMQRYMSDMKKQLTDFSNTVKEIEKELIASLSLVMNETIKDKYKFNDYVNEWWNNNIEFCEENKITSNEIWNLFKKQNKEFIEENLLTIDCFKEILKEIIDKDKYNTKNNSGKIEFIGFRFIKTEEPNKDKRKQNNKSEILSQQKKKNYINEIIDNNIIDVYNNTDKNIMDLAREFETEPNVIISILHGNKIINSRKESRGYNIYIETDYYKNKISSAEQK